MLPAPLSTSARAHTHTQSNFTPFWAQHFSGLSFHYCSKTLAKYRVPLIELLQLLAEQGQQEPGLHLQTPGYQSKSHTCLGSASGLNNFYCTFPCHSPTKSLSSSSPHSNLITGELLMAIKKTASQIYW